ncbi:Predicted metal-binding protein [Humidesulfovibrio mexicanus]|uniref:Predicted metal-binding protein n=1 Tax=Humidesulfovibrio mexicanus TaxID=147047 RepID=A0A239BNY7_9BACT|nr:CGGC domain-containing protein [Humidesulfovibrio mexicanus]SNS09807.1 Predicted metal-binding protein [Humidesulfovibrio mexicanus]
MSSTVKIGIVICDRYKSCAGGKCLRALKNRQGAFDVYARQEVELVGYTSCGGCPGGNVEYLGEEMLKNGVEVIHLATGLVVGYPPCPHIAAFTSFLAERFGVKVVVGTHPIPEKYLDMHTRLKTWDDPAWAPLVAPTMSDATTRLSYD